MCILSRCYQRSDGVENEFRRGRDGEVKQLGDGPTEKKSDGVKAPSGPAARQSLSPAAVKSPQWRPNTHTSSNIQGISCTAHGPTTLPNRFPPTPKQPLHTVCEL